MWKEKVGFMTIPFIYALLFFITGREVYWSVKSHLDPFFILLGVDITVIAVIIASFIKYEKLKLYRIILGFFTVISIVFEILLMRTDKMLLPLWGVVCFAGIWLIRNRIENKNLVMYICECFNIAVIIAGNVWCFYIEATTPCCVGG